MEARLNAATPVPRWLGPAIVLGCWSASRYLAWRQGVAFDSGDLSWAWQFLDVGELRQHLARSLLYLHAQPPGFNLFLGLGLKLAQQPAGLYGFAFLLLGALLSLCLYGTLRLLGLGLKLSVLGASFFALCPASILYENWLFYTYPATALLTFAALALGLALSSGRRLAWSLFFGLLAALVLSVALFHLVWFALSLGLIWWLVPGQRKVVLPTAVPWLLLAGSLYVKNLVLFGAFSGSSWFGMNLARVAEAAIPIETRQAEVQQGQLSSLALIPPFSDPRAYPEALEATQRSAPDVPVLTEIKRSTGSTNYNNAVYPLVSRAYLADSLKLMFRHPSGYAFVLERNWLVFMLPPSEYRFLKNNRARMADYTDLFNRWVYGVLTWGPAPPPPYTDPRLARPTELLAEDGLAWAALALAGWLMCCALLVRELRTRKGPLEPRVMLLAFLLFTSAFVSLVGNLCEYSENHRFRYMVEPFFVALICVGLDTLVNRASQWRRGAPRSSYPARS